MEELYTDGTITNCNLGCKGWKGETEVFGRTNFTIRFDIDKITQIGRFRFVEEIVSNRYDIVL